MLIISRYGPCGGDIKGVVSARFCGVCALDVPLFSLYSVPRERDVFHLRYR